MLFSECRLRRIQSLWLSWSDPPLRNRSTRFAFALVLTVTQVRINEEAKEGGGRAIHDFVEVDLPVREATFARLLRKCAEELGLGTPPPPPPLRMSTRRFLRMFSSLPLLLFEACPFAAVR